MIEKILDGFVDLIELIANPIFAVVVDSELLVAFGVFVDKLLDETGDVPEFVAKVATGDDFAGAEGLIDAGGATSDKAETKRVGPILADDFDGVDDVAFRLGHFLAFFVEDHTVHVDIFEWHIARDVKAKHNHATDPLKEEVGARLHD